MPRTLAPIHFAGSSLCNHRHVCAFFTSPDDEYRVMTPKFTDSGGTVAMACDGDVGKGSVFSVALPRGEREIARATY